MAAPIDQALSDEMKKIAQGVRDRMAGGNFTPTWNLGGKNSIVEPGRDVIIRLAPRWDFANSKILQGEKRVPNPDYKVGLPFVIAWEHWWAAEGGAKTRDWCPRTIWPDCRCPVCLASTAMVTSGGKADKEFGKNIAPKQVFLYNAMVGDPRRLVDPNGLVDIRPIACPGTVFAQISDIVNGGDKPQFARGDITDPREGYDLALRRPTAGGAERWSVQVSGNASPLYSPAQAAAFRGWVNRLVDLPAMLESEVKKPEAIFKAFYGRDPRPEEIAGAGASKPSGAVDTSATAVPPTAVSPTAVPPMDPDDDFLPPPSTRR